MCYQAFEFFDSSARMPVWAILAALALFIAGAAFPAGPDLMPPPAGHEPPPFGATVAAGALMSADR